MKTAALLVIGDEILNGKVKDENIFVFANTMFDRGVSLRHIEVIPDVIDIIAERVAHTSKSYDYIATSGGVGPTHDDITLDGVAKAFALPLCENEEALRYFQSAQEKAGRGSVVSPVQRKMLTFPTPCSVYFEEALWLPLVQVKNVYIFPGVPYLFQKLLGGLSHLFQGTKIFHEKILTDQNELAIAHALKVAHEANPSITIGSYPAKPGVGYHVMVTVQGRDEGLVERIVEDLLPKIAGRRAEK